MSRQTWVTRDAQGNVTSSTEVHLSSGCGGCVWLTLGVFVVVGPAAWAGDGQIPVALAAVMYAVEALVALAVLIRYGTRRNARLG